MVLIPTNPTPIPQSTPSSAVRVSQIVCGAMVAAILTFMVIAHVLGNGGQPPKLSYFGLGFAALSVVLQFILPGVVVKRQLNLLKVDDVDNRSPQFCQLFQTQKIIRSALLEGACFLNLVAYMTERQWWSVAVTGFLVAIMLLNLPTMNQFDSWVDDVRRSIENQF